MRQRKYTLPRHTNLATVGSRLGAFIIDAAICLAFTLLSFYGCFQFVFKGKCDSLVSSINQERIKSHLFYEGEDGSISYYSNGCDNNELKGALEYFYITYIPEISNDATSKVKLDNGSEATKKDYFTYEWFNEEILKVETSGALFFEYNEGNKTDPALFKKDIEESDVNSYLLKIWKNNAVSDFNSLPYFYNLNSELGFYSSIQFIFALVVACSLTYIFIPWLLKNGVTAGKKAFGLCLANSEGYRISNFQLLLRIIPVFITVLTLLLPIWQHLATSILFYFVMLMISYAFLMASPKRSALHDFCAHTIVVNAKSSILFNNLAEEEEYTRKEDGLEDKKELDGGEEPNLNYEK